WDGGGADDNWMTGANWQGDSIPSPGDSLVFPSGVPRNNNVNNFPAGTIFDYIIFSGSGYTLSGAKMALLSGITALNSSGLNQLSLPLSLNSDQTFKSGAAGATLFIGPSSLDLNGKNLIVSSNGTTTISATIIGAGSLTKLGNSILNLSVSNSYVGPTFVLEGQVSIANGQS